MIRFGWVGLARALVEHWRRTVCQLGGITMLRFIVFSPLRFGSLKSLGDARQLLNLPFKLLFAVKLVMLTDRWMEVKFV